MGQPGEVIAPGAGEATGFTVSAAFFDREPRMKGGIDEQGSPKGGGALGTMQACADVFVDLALYLELEEGHGLGSPGALHQEHEVTDSLDGSAE